MPKQHLLLVDGDPRTLHRVQASLRAAGFGVTAAASGDAALALCRSSPPDVVVAEIALPGMDGFQLCEALRGDDALRDIPMVFVSGQPSAEDTVRARCLGVADLLAKPVDPRELVTRARAAVARRLRERLPAGDAVLQVDYLSLSERLEDVPEELNAVLKRIDGRRTLAQLLEYPGSDALETVSAIIALLREEIVHVRTAVPPDTTPIPPPPRIVRFDSPVEIVPEPTPAAVEIVPEPTPAAVEIVEMEPPRERRQARPAVVAIAAAVIVGAVAAWTLFGAREPAPLRATTPAESYPTAQGR